MKKSIRHSFLIVFNTRNAMIAILSLLMIFGKVLVGMLIFKIYSVPNVQAEDHYNKVTDLLRVRPKTLATITPPPIQIQLGQSERIRATVISHDSQYVAVADHDSSTVKLWSLKNGMLIHVFSGSGQNSGSLAFTKDNKHLLFNNKEYFGLELRDVITGKRVQTFMVKEDVIDDRNVAISHDDHTVIGVLNEFLVVFDTMSGVLKARLGPHSDHISTLALSPIGPQLASADYKGQVIVWRLDTLQKEKTLSHHREEIEHLLFSPDGRLLLSVDNKGEARLWNVDEGKIIHTLEGLTSAPENVAFSPDSKHIVLCESKKAILWNTTSGKHILTIKYDQTDLTCPAIFTPTGNALMMSNLTGIRILDPTSGAVRRSLGKKNKDTTDVDDSGVDWTTGSFHLTPDGASILSTSDNHLALRRFDTGEVRLKMRGVALRPNSSVLHPTQKYLATLLSSNFYSEIHIWNLEEGRLEQRLKPSKSDARFANALAISPDGTLIAMGNNEGVIYIWHFSSGKQFRVIKVEEGNIGNLSFSPDSKYLAANTWNEADNIHIWEVDTGKLTRSIVPENGAYSNVSFNKQGHLITSITKYLEEDNINLIEIWDLKKDVSIAQHRINAPNSFRKQEIHTLSPSGRILVTFGRHDALEVMELLPEHIRDAYALKVIDLEHNRIKHFFLPDTHTTEIGTPVFSPDSRKLAFSVGKSGSIELIDLEKGQWIKSFQGHLGSSAELVFSDDGRYLFSTAKEGAVRRWELQGTSVITFVSQPDGWIIFDEKGHYITKGRGATLATHIRDGQSHALSTKNHQPEALRKSLRGAVPPPIK